MKHGSLFSGIGGFDLAAEWMGWENVFHCEWNEFGKKILNHYWPNSISYHDITKTDFTIHRGAIDILTGGFPCQPYSAAGKRLGTEDERHLWPEMLRAIREIQPGWVVGENVLGLTNWNGGLVFEEVQTDLEAQGYEVQAYVLPACGVNAPHKRDRVWFVAWNTNSRAISRDREKQKLFDTDKNTNSVGICEGPFTYSESNRNRRILSRMEGKNDSEREPEKHGKDNMQYWNNGTQWNAPNTFCKRLQGHELNGAFNEGKERKQAFRPVAEFSESCDVANSDAAGEWRDERKSKSKRSRWEQFPTQSPLCSRNDGLSSKLDGITFPKHRNESIKAYGNAIVPQVVFQIFKAIEAMES